MKKIMIFIAVLCVGFTFAQKKRTLELNKATNLTEVTYYHDNNQVSQTGFYDADGKLHGEWTSYSLDGNKLASAKYENGKKVGKWFFWVNNTLQEVDYAEGVIAVSYTHLTLPTIYSV